MPTSSITLDGQRAFFRMIASVILICLEYQLEGIQTQSGTDKVISLLTNIRLHITHHTFVESEFNSIILEQECKLCREGSQL